MNCAKMLDLLMGRLGSRTEASLRQICLDEMTLAQADLLENRPELPWFCLVEDQVVSTVANVRTVAFPADLIRLDQEDERPLAYVPSSGQQVILEQKALDDNLVWYSTARTGSPMYPSIVIPGERPGPPEKYSVRKNNLLIFPLPDAVYNIRFYAYFARLAAPVDNANFENDWMKYCPSLLMAHTGLIVATQHLQDDSLIQTFAGEIPMLEKRFDDLITARAEAGRDRRAG